MDNKHIQLGVTVDATKARSGLNEVGEAAQKTARDINQAGQQAGKGIDGIGASAEKSAAQVQRAYGRIEAEIRRVTAAAQAQAEGTGKAGEIINKALAQGLDPARFSPALEKLRQLEAGTANLGLTAKQTTAAMRQVPAQFTDIVVSLQGGQNPMTVLLQQGGQLKDVFGGAGAAAKALGGYILGLVNPYTVAAAAVTAVAVAAYQGASEFSNLSREIILSGGAAGVSASGLMAMAGAINQANGSITKSRAAEVLGQIAASSGVASSEMQRFAKNALKFERAGGGAAESVVKAFKELSQDPLKASLKLNESMNYLTDSVYRQIRALDEQGKKTEAATVAQAAYDKAIEQRSRELESNLGLIELAWRSVGDAAKSAWDRMLDIGRPETQQDVTKRLQTELSNKLASPNLNADNEVGRQIRARVNDLREALGYQSELERMVAREASARADSAKQVQARAEWDERGLSYLSKRQKMEREIVAERERGRKAGASEVEIEERIGKIREKYKEHSPREKAEHLSEEQRALSSYVQSLQTRLNKEEELTEVQKANNFLASLGTEGQIPQVRELVLAMAQRLDIEKQSEAVMKSYAASFEASTRETQSLEDQIKAREAEVAAIGQSHQATAELAAGKLELAAAEKEAYAAALEGASAYAGEFKDLYLREAEAARDQAGKLRRLAGLEREKGIREAAEDASKEWAKAAEKIENTLTDALMRGFESGKGFAEVLRDTVVNMFKTMVLRPVVAAVVSPLAYSLAGPANASGGGGGVGVGDAYNAYSMATGSASWLANFGGTFNNYLNQAGGKLFNAGLEQIGGTLVDWSNTYGQTISEVADFAGDALGYANAVLAFSKGQYGTAIGSALGTYFGGPIGAFIGSKIGSLVDGAFGRKLVSSGVQGHWQGSAGQFAGGQWEFNKGGAFRSDKTVNSAVPAELQTLLNDAYSAVASGLLAFNKALGGSSDTLSDWSHFMQQGLLGKTADQVKEILAGEIGKMTESMAREVLFDLGKGALGGDVLGGIDAKQARISELETAMMDRGARKKTWLGWQAERDALQAEVDALYNTVIGPFQKAGETAQQTLARLGGSLGTINAAFDTLGLTLLQGVAGAQQASSVLDAFGGADAFNQLAGSYYQAFYSEAERTATTTRQVTEQLALLGYAMPATRDEFRALVEAQDLTTDSGRSTFAALMGVSGAFASVTDSAEKAAQSLIDEARRLRGEVDRGGSRGYAASLAAFTTQTAMARAGDAGALSSLVGLSADLEKAAAGVLSARELDRLRLTTANSLWETTQHARVINGSHADGLPFVPFDGYVAELHRGERVLTAEQNVSYSAPVVNAPAQAGQGRGMGALLDEVRRLREQNQRLAASLDELRHEVRAGVGFSRSIDDTLSRVTRGKLGINTKPLEAAA